MSPGAKLPLPDVPPLVPDGATFAFGESPFRTKGVLYQATQGFFEDNLRGGVRALASEMAEPQLRDFITQRFLTSGWYDVMPVPSLIAYEARALRMRLDDYLLYRTRYQARRDLSGIYSWVLRVARPSIVAPRLPSVVGWMFDFVRVEIVREESNEMLATLHGIPAVLVPWLNTSFVVYAETALKLAGATTVDAIRPPETDEGTAAGVQVVRLDLHIRWT